MDIMIKKLLDIQTFLKFTYDVAVRDLVMEAGAFTLAKLSNLEASVNPVH